MAVGNLELICNEAPVNLLNFLAGSFDIALEANLLI